MDNDFRRYRAYQPGEFIICAADTAAGGGDFCAAQFLSKTRLDVPNVYHSDSTATIMTPLIHQELEAIYDITKVRPVVAFERENGGAFEMDRLASLNKLGKYRIYTMKVLDAEGKLVDSGKLGWDTNSGTRPKMMQDGKEMVEKHLLTLYDRPTINEMFSLVVVKTTSSWKAQAEVGAHDDLIMSLFIAWQLYQTEAPEKGPQNYAAQIPSDLPPDMVLGNVSPHNRTAMQGADSADPFNRRTSDIYRPPTAPNDNPVGDIWE